MGANGKLAATFHPAVYECAYCETRYTSPIAARECCSDAWLRAID